MSDDEGRRQEAHEEEMLERALRKGTMILCMDCDMPTMPYFQWWDDDKDIPLCKVCRARREEEADGEEEG